MTDELKQLVYSLETAPDISLTLRNFTSKPLYITFDDEEDFNTLHISNLETSRASTIPRKDILRFHMNFKPQHVKLPEYNHDSTNYDCVNKSSKVQIIQNLLEKMIKKGKLKVVLKPDFELWLKVLKHGLGIYEIIFEDSCGEYCMNTNTGFEIYFVVDI